METKQNQKNKFLKNNGVFITLFNFIVQEWVEYRLDCSMVKSKNFNFQITVCDIA